MPTFAHADGVSTCSPAAGSVLARVLAAEPEWSLVNDRHESAQGDQLDAEIPEDLHALKRDELDQLAAGLGVDDAADLPNKDAVIAAIHTVTGGDA